jgi:putative transposase
MLPAIFMLLCFLRLLWNYHFTKPKPKPSQFKRPTKPQQPNTNTQFKKKPDWVIDHIISSKAWNKSASCRQIAELFNRSFAVERNMTLSKSYVATMLIEHHGDIARLRAKWKANPPGEGRKLQIWGMDLTFVADLSSKQRVILGVIDHGNRACVALSELTDKTSSSILRALISTFRKFGIPKAIRVDNEICFHSILLRSAFALLGIKVQKTNKHSPWQNGRIERMFGTLKADFEAIMEGCMTTLLAEWRWYYNFARPHQHLNYKTPAECWNGQKRATGVPHLIELWDGKLKAWYFAPS